MAILAGNITSTLQTTPSTTNADFGQLVEPDFTLSWQGSDPLAGGKTDNQPISAHVEHRDGVVIHQYAFLDFYNRIHVTPVLINLGNVVSVQERTVSVWNGYFTPHQLNQIVEVGMDGITLTDPVGQPFVFGPLQEVFYTLSANTAGPPTIDARLTFDFESIDITVSITGIRVVAWIWEANWIEPPVEKLEWSTDILPGDDGSEQRRQLREYPRAYWEFTFDIEGDQRRTFENIIYSWGARVWALPIWSDIQTLMEEVPAASQVIPAVTEGTDFHAGGLGILIGSDGAHESVEIEAVNPDSIEIARPLVRTWLPGTRLYPARGARLQDPRSFGRLHRNYVRGFARFKTEEEIAGAALTETTYRDYPVMEIRPNWREAPEIDYQRKLLIRAFGTGRDEVEDEAELALPVHSWRWTCLTRADVTQFRQWLYARRGKQKAVWVPTWADDLRLASTVAASDINMVFVACGLVHFAAEGVHRRDIRIELKDHRVFYRRLSNYVAIDNDLERVTINTVFGETIRPEDVESISWMHLLRQDADAIEIAWQNAGCTEAQIVMKGPRNVV